MKYAPYFLLWATLLFFLSQKAHAEIKVEISGNDEGSSSRVEVRSNVHSSSQNNSSSQVRTEIRIESNGQVKTYRSDKPEDIHVQSEDGKAQVHVNTQTNTIQQQTSAPNTDEQKKSAVEKQKSEAKVQRATFLQELNNRIKDLRHIVLSFLS